MAGWDSSSWLSRKPDLEATWGARQGEEGVECAKLLKLCAGDDAEEWGLSAMSCQRWLNAGEGCVRWERRRPQSGVGALPAGVRPGVVGQHPT